MIMAIGIFAIVLMGVGWSWDYVIDKTQEDSETKSMEILAKNSITILLETSGAPSDWYLKDEEWFNDDEGDEDDDDDEDEGNGLNIPDNLESIGLSVSYPSVLHKDKVVKLNELSDTHYVMLRNVLGLRKYQFHIGFYIYDGDTYPNTPNYQAGNSSVGLAERVVVVTRYATINSNWTRVNYKVWK